MSNTMTISQYMALPQSERPSVRYRNELVDSIQQRGDNDYVICQGMTSHGRRQSDTILQVWEANDIRERVIGVQGELANTYFDVYQEYERSRREPESDWEHKYWQGKKDGMRITLAALNELMPDGHDWEGLQESSNKGRGTRLQVITAQVKEAIRVFKDIETDGLDRYNKRQIASFLEWIEHARKEFGIDYKDEAE